MAVSQSYNITVVPASTKTGKATIATLLVDPRNPKVVGYYRDLSKVPEEFAAHPNFSARQGDVADGKTLDFEGADAVLAITPPRLDGTEDMVEHARSTSLNVRFAVMNTRSVKRLAYLSSMGAQFETGVGEIRTNNIAEKILRDASFEVVFLRAAYFMENFAMSIPSAKTNHAIQTMVPSDWAIPMVSVQDIAEACRHVLLARFSGAFRRGAPLTFEIHGPRSYNGIDVQEAMSEAAGEEVQVTSVPKERLAEYFCGQKLPLNLIPEFVEMTRCFLPGGIMAKDIHNLKENELRRGDRELSDVLRDLWDME